jgi:hypothetical protein
MDRTVPVDRREPWRKGSRVGQMAPLKVKEQCALWNGTA